MPKVLFSKMHFYDIKDLVKRTRRIDIVLTRNRRKNEVQTLKVNKKEDFCRSKLSWDGEHKRPWSLEKVLKNKKYLEAFCSFLKSEFSDENIEFWLACEDFRTTASPNDLQRKASEIYKTFIQPTASREINVDHHVKEKIKMCLEKPSLSCFDEAQKHVYLLMQTDSCPRFLTSDAFQRLNLKSRTLWYI
ncbi:Regulator of G-protein signaling 1 [Oryzias melastigma]|uniref:Regulator of G-protein signaling 1 n=1 Tax=Oryzias melastigma TaxID=30732 RepID=A0A834BV99_ORYME|nr:regulator of G-protein signaling 21 isoform X1 [Oryzias melastigma]KAF6718060.1 Regulator of G-protein signaling 1 [Oryzias melastigma]